MVTMKKKQMLMMLLVCAVIVVLVPICMKYVLGMELRNLPTAEKLRVSEASVDTQTETQDQTLAIVPDYGYYPDDHWTEKQCGFYFTAPSDGEMTLSIYYPFELAGNETGQIYVDQDYITDFLLTGENSEVSIPCGEGQHYIQINSDFAREPGEEDKRALAFVLSGVMFMDEESNP